MKKLYTIALCAMGLMLLSCNSKTDKSVPTHFPFKAKETDKWGFVDNKGNIVFENLFDGIPTCVFNDMFYVETDEGYELYSIKNPKEKLGGPYLSMANFKEDLAPCTYECDNIKYINKKGEVVFELPNNAVRAFEFENGYSSFILKNGDDYVTKIVDTKGSIMEFNGYSLLRALNNGTFLASKGEKEEEYVILDKDGKELYQLEGLQYSTFCLSSDLKYYVCDEGVWDSDNKGVRCVDGRVLFENEYSRVSFAEDGNIILGKGTSLFASLDDKECVVKDINGQTLFRSDYDVIVNCRNGIIIAIRDGKFGAVDYNGKTIINFNNDVLAFVPGTHLIVGSKDNNSPVRLFDEQGLAVSEYANFAFVNLIGSSPLVLSMSPNLYEALWYTFPTSGVETDCFDAEGLVKTFLHPDGKSFSNLLGFAGLTPGECAKRMSKSYSVSDIEEDNQCLPFEELSSNDFGTIMISLGFDEVVHTEYDWFGNVHYSYSDAPCEFMILSQNLRIESQFHSNHIKKLDNVIVSVLEEEGYSEKYDRNQDLVFYENGNVQLVYQLNPNELRMIVQASSVQNSASLSPEFRQQSNSDVNLFVVIDGSQLRLRLGPSTSSDTFKWPDGTNRHPNVGEKFRYLGESGDFYKIDFNGNELWVSKQYTHLE
jgi:hypothetical protein